MNCDDTTIPPATARPRPEPPTLRELLPRHLDALTGFVQRRLSRSLRERESASDLVDSICGDLLAAQTPFEYRDEGQFHGWLQQVVLHKIHGRLRHDGAAKRGRDRTFAAAPSELEAACADHESPSHHAVRAEDITLLDRALAALPADCRDILVQVHLLGRCHADVARDAGCTVEATRTRLKRAKAKLAGLLDRLQRSE